MLFVGFWFGVGLGRVIWVFLLLLCFVVCGGMFYFYIGEMEKKCFIEEILDEIMVIGVGGGGEFGIRLKFWGGGCGRVSCLEFWVVGCLVFWWLWI